MIAPTSNINATRICSPSAFFIAHLVLAVFITDTEAEKSVIYGSRRTKFIEGKRLIFDVGLNCTTLQPNFTGLLDEAKIKGK
jgi:hypothetical protein